MQYCDSRGHKTPGNTKTPVEQDSKGGGLQWSSGVLRLQGAQDSRGHKTPGGTRLQGAPRLQWSKTPGEQTPVEQWSAKRFGVGGAGAPLLPARDEQLVAATLACLQAPGNCWPFPWRGCRRSRSCSSGGGEANRSNLGRPAGGVAGGAPVVGVQLPTAIMVGLWEEGQEPLQQGRSS